MTKRLILFAVAASFLLSSTAFGQNDKFAKMLLRKAKKYYGKRADLKYARKARETYEKVLAMDSDNIEARWRLGRVLYWLGTHTSGDEAKKKLFEQGIRYCQEAIKKDDGCIPCHYWLGVSYGKFGEAKGVLQSLGLVPHAKKALNKVKEANPGYEYAGAYRVLGRIYFKVPSIKGGDNDKAIRYLKKAVEMGPKYLMNRRFLAEVLLKEGKKKEAKKQLRFILDLSESEFLSDKKPESKEEKKKAQKLWDEHF